MDLLVIFEGQDVALRAALKDLKEGKSASVVASTHIKPVIQALEKNARQELDPLYVSYLLEYVVINSRNGQDPLQR